MKFVIYFFSFVICFAVDELGNDVGVVESRSIVHPSFW